MSLLGILVICLVFGSSYQDDCGVGWTAYSDSKCFQLIKDQKVTEDKLESSATLMTIGSANEQQFINDMVSGFGVTSKTFWIGLEFANNGWKWMDGLALTYTNWDSGANTKGSTVKPCAKMSLSLLSGNGLWTDDQCSQQYQVVCQKLSPLYKLTKRVDNITSAVDQQQGQLNNQQAQITSLKNSDTTQQGQINSLQTTSTNQQAQIQAIQSQNSDQDSHLQKQQADIQALQAQAQTEQAQIQTTQDANTQQQDQIDALVKQAADQQAQIVNQQGALESLQGQTAAQNAQMQVQQAQIDDLQNQIKTLQSESSSQQTQIDALIPINYTYVQLSGQASPHELWPTYYWQDVTQQYAGLFFRAEGNGSAPFTEVQEELAPSRVIDQFQNTYGTDLDVCAFGTECNVAANGWSDYYFTGRDFGDQNVYIRFHTRNSTGEVRPRNMAMRIWQRVNTNQLAPAETVA